MPLLIKIKITENNIMAKMEEEAKEILKSEKLMDIALNGPTAMGITKDAFRGALRLAFKSLMAAETENAALKARRFSSFTEAEVYILKRMCMECGQIFAEKAYTEKDSEVLYSLHEEILAHIRSARAVEKYTEAAEKAKEGQK